MSAGTENTHQRLVLPLSAWPDRDRHLWELATGQKRGPFRKHGGGKSLNRYTVQAREKAYGRWLHHLQQTGELDPEAPPSVRVTEERLDGFIERMTMLGNRPITIIGRIEGLEAALRCKRCSSAILPLLIELCWVFPR